MTKVQKSELIKTRSTLAISNGMLENIRVSFYGERKPRIVAKVREMIYHDRTLMRYSDIDDLETS